jgi:ATP-binding protein involved in chromosome partitioning
LCTNLQVPLEVGIRTTSDAGTPIVASHPDSKAAEVYREMAAKVKQKLSHAPRQFAQRGKAAGQQERPP